MLIFPAMAFAEPLATDSTTSASLPTIQSDKDLYSPGELVTLTGSGWQAGEKVNIVVNDDQGKTWSRNADVTADASGNISDSFNLPDWFVATYSVKATGASGAVATTTFADPELRVHRGPTGNPPNVSFTVDWRRYTDSTCSTAATSGGGLSGSATVNNDTGTNLQGGSGGVPPGQGGFVKITAPQTPTSPTTYTFVHWTSVTGSANTIAQTSDASICVRNPGGSNNDAYRATYKPANTEPTISDIGNQTSTEDNAISDVPFTVGDAQTAAANLTLSGSSSNQTLVPDSNITFGGSGANRTVTITPAPDKIGTATITVTVTDAENGTASDTFTIDVNFKFDCFRQPVDNNGVFNTVKAGSAIPVKFSLFGNKGLSIFAPLPEPKVGFYPMATQVTCPKAMAMDAVEEIVAASNSGLTYDSSIDQYNYVWKTTSTMATKCYRLDVKFIDGETKSAYFNFTR
jgi:hypothetical protein